MVTRGRHAAPCTSTNVNQLPSDKVLEAWVQRDGDVEPVEALFVPDREAPPRRPIDDMDGVEAVMVTAEPAAAASRRPVATDRQRPIPQ